MVEETTRREGLQLVEILHIDTEGSQEFFTKLEVSAAEKCECQRLLFNLFSQCCQQFGGAVASWQGDGGHAFFPVGYKSGNSIQAARDFISKLSVLAQQTATTLGRRVTPDTARRKFRIKAHFGTIFFAANPGLDSGPSSELDAFLKYEKELAPFVDELFITEQLRAQLGGPERSLFQRHKEAAPYGSLSTALYRMQWQPKDRARNILEAGRSPKDITDSEWQFLKSHILSQRMNVTARNSITTGLIKLISDPQSRGQITHAGLTTVTIRALYNYLRAVYLHHAFHIAVWRPVQHDEPACLEKIASYPTKQPPGRVLVSLDDARYRMVRAFNSCSPVVTSCVDEARLNGEWVDHDASEADRSHGLHSALQLPIYRTKKQVGEYAEKETMGVLSVDSDKPDFFMKEEVDVWTEDLVGIPCKSSSRGAYIPRWPHRAATVALLRKTGR